MAVNDGDLVRRIARLSDEGDLNHLVYDLVKAARRTCQAHLLDPDAGQWVGDQRALALAELSAALKPFEGP